MNLLLLFYVLKQAGLGIIGVSGDDNVRELPLSTWHERNGASIRLDWATEPSQSDVDIADATIEVFDPDGELPWIEHKKNVRQQVLDLLGGKTPGEILTWEQANIDEITSLAEAKAFLRSRIPIIEAVIAWALGYQDE
jgi:hypothetical protein